MILEIYPFPDEDSVDICAPNDKLIAKINIPMGMLVIFAPIGHVRQPEGSFIATYAPGTPAERVCYAMNLNGPEDVENALAITKEFVELAKEQGEWE